MKHLLVISGYSRAGKTTAIKYFRDECNFEVASTSEMMHAGLESFFERIGFSNIDSYDKKVSIDVGFQSEYAGETVYDRFINTTMRDLCIAYIESSIEHIYGREALGAAGARSLNPDSEYHLYECFNYVEYLGFMEEYTKRFGRSRVDVLEIQSPMQLQGVDGRELLGNTPWVNDQLCNSKDHTYQLHSIFNNYDDKYVEDLQDLYLNELN